MKDPKVDTIEAVRRGLTTKTTLTGLIQCRHLRNLKLQMRDVPHPARAGLNWREFCEQVQHFPVGVHDIGLEPANPVGNSQAREELQEKRAQPSALKVVMHGQGDLGGSRSGQPHVPRAADEASDVLRLNNAHDAGLVRPVNGEQLAQLVGRDAADGAEEAVQQGFARGGANGFGDKRFIVRSHMPEAHERSVGERPVGKPLGLADAGRFGFCHGIGHGFSMRIRRIQRKRRKRISQINTN